MLKERGPLSWCDAEALNVLDDTPIAGRIPLLYYCNPPYDGLPGLIWC
jgi:hypothetical protein